MAENKNQPTFWLEVRKEYVVDNFENLLRYLRLYNYKIDEETSDNDFDKSYLCLGQVVTDLTGDMALCNLSSSASNVWNQNESLHLRMIATYLLASDKKHQQDHNVLLLLADYLLLNSYCDNSQVLSEIQLLAYEAAIGAPVVRYGFSWDDLTKENFTPYILATKLSQTQFGKAPESPYWYYEGRGLLRMENNHIALVNMNLCQYQKTQVTKQIEVNSYLDIMTKKYERSNKTEFPGLFQLSRDLYNEQQKVQPSPICKPKEYMPEDELIVKVTFVDGDVQAESIDPKYEKVKGKVFITNNFCFIPKEHWWQVLRVGDYLKVKRIEEMGYVFSLDDSFDNFYETQGKAAVHDSCDAVFFEEFNGGIRCITRDGLLVNIFGESLSTMDEKRPIKVLVKGCKRDKNHHVVLNAEFAYVDTPDDDSLIGKDFIDDAQQWLIEQFIEYCEPSEIPTSDKTVGSVISSEAVSLLSHILFKESQLVTDTYERYNRLLAARMIAFMAGNQYDCAWLSHELNYQNSIIKFSMGESVKTLYLPENIELSGDKRIKRESDVIQKLECYIDERFEPERQRNTFTTEDIDYLDQLIKASNTLNGKIELCEINRIKRSIASFLGVGDIYQNIYRDLTYYGEESDTLEFKTSVVFSQNMRPDLSTQKWTILKTICGFLNTVSGGELLLGVNDKGYSSDLRQDLEWLYKNQKITEMSMDKYRLFVKYMIDHAFMDEENTIRGGDITATRIRLLIEKNDEGMELLRIQVQPYEYGIICLDDKLERPEHIKESYYRTSGATIPMTREIKKTILEKKIQFSADRDIRMMLLLRQACKERKQVILRGYTSKSGTKDRNVEVYQILTKQQVAITYDIDKKEIREYKISRIRSVDITGQNWKYAHKHRNLRIDIFNIMENPKNAPVRVKLKLSNLAYNLIREEYPASLDVLMDNTEDDKELYPMMLKTEVFSLMGIGRFYLGLIKEIKVIEGEELVLYAKDYVKRLENL